ncbi:hypothetical protein KJZ61_02035 [Candidatus Dependentiae bacterium]|nr:hypothetical protein [Candidatus Dependentiae bacterium]
MKIPVMVTVLLFTSYSHLMAMDNHDEFSLPISSDPTTNQSFLLNTDTQEHVDIPTSHLHVTTEEDPNLLSSTDAELSPNNQTTFSYPPTINSQENTEFMALAQRFACQTQAENAYDHINPTSITPSYDRSNSLRIHVPPNSRSWFSTAYQHLTKNIIAYYHGALPTYGPAILSGTLEKESEILSKSSETILQQTTMGHLADRVICEAAEIVFNNGDRVAQLFSYLDSCLTNKYWLNRATLMMVLATLAYNQQRINQQAQCRTLLKTQIQANVGIIFPSHVSQNVPTQEPLILDNAVKQLNETKKIFSAIAQRINTPLTPHTSSQTQGLIPALFSKAGAEVSRKIQGDAAYGKDDLEHGTLERRVHDFAYCSSETIERCFQRLTGRISPTEKVDQGKDDMLNVFKFMRGCVRVGHMADRVIREIAQQKRPEQDQTIALVNITHLLQKCNEYHYHLHPYTETLVTMASNNFSLQEPYSLSDLGTANTELLEAINTLRPPAYKQLN